MMHLWAELWWSDGGQGVVCGKQNEAALAVGADLGLLHCTRSCCVALPCQCYSTEQANKNWMPTGLSACLPLPPVPSFTPSPAVHAACRS